MCQICLLSLSFFNIVSQTFKSNLKSFGLVIWKCNSTLKDFATVRQSRDSFLPQNLWHYLATLSFTCHFFRHRERKFQMQSQFFDTVIQFCKSTQKDFDNARQKRRSLVKTFRYYHRTLQFTFHRFWLLETEM